jgi:small GTP-binding protein
MTEDIKEEETNPIKCKIILVGDSGVGKTSLIGRYIKKYEPNVRSTISTSFFSKLEIINNYLIDFQIWDTIGQERYRSLNDLFFKDAHICIIVYDITHLETFKNIKDYWYESAITNGLEGIIIGIAGNKNDLYEYEQVNREEVQDFCNEIDGVLKFTSAKDNFCVDELFKELGIKFVNSDFMKGIREKSEEEGKKFKIGDNKNIKAKKKKKGCC